MEKLQSHEPDKCCGKHISKALRNGELDAAEQWECPACGERWKPRDVNGLKHWEPAPVIVVLRG